MPVIVDNTDVKKNTQLDRTIIETLWEQEGGCLGEDGTTKFTISRGNIGESVLLSILMRIFESRFPHIMELIESFVEDEFYGYDSWEDPSYYFVRPDQWVIWTDRCNTDWTCCSGWNTISVKVVDENPYLTSFPNDDKDDGMKQYFINFDQLIVLTKDNRDWKFLVKDKKIKIEEYSDSDYALTAFPLFE